MRKTPSPFRGDEKKFVACSYKWFFSYLPPEFPPPFGGLGLIGGLGVGLTIGGLGVGGGVGLGVVVVVVTTTGCPPLRSPPIKPRSGSLLLLGWFWAAWLASCPRPPSTWPKSILTVDQKTKITWMAQQTGSWKRVILPPFPQSYYTISLLAALKKTLSPSK